MSYSSVTTREGMLPLVPSLVLRQAAIPCTTRSPRPAALLQRAEEAFFGVLLAGFAAMAVSFLWQVVR
jgi:hypothetical protein